MGILSKNDVLKNAKDLVQSTDLNTKLSLMKNQETNAEYVEYYLNKMSELNSGVDSVHFVYSTRGGVIGKFLNLIVKRVTWMIKNSIFPSLNAQKKINTFVIESIRTLNSKNDSVLNENKVQNIFGVNSSKQSLKKALDNYSGILSSAKEVLILDSNSFDIDTSDFGDKAVNLLNSNESDYLKYLKDHEKAIDVIIFPSSIAFYDFEYLIDFFRTAFSKLSENGKVIIEFNNPNNIESLKEILIQTFGKATIFDINNFEAFVSHFDGKKIEYMPFDMDGKLNTEISETQVYRYGAIITK